MVVVVVVCWAANAFEAVRETNVRVVVVVAVAVAVMEVEGKKMDCGVGIKEVVTSFHFSHARTNSSSAADVGLANQYCIGRLCVPCNQEAIAWPGVD